MKFKTAFLFLMISSVCFAQSFNNRNNRGTFQYNQSTTTEEEKNKRQANTLTGRQGTSQNPYGSLPVQYVEVLIDGQRVFVPKDKALAITTTPVPSQTTVSTPNVRTGGVSVRYNIKSDMNPSLKKWPREALGVTQVEKSLSGSGVTIALFDSGVSPHRRLASESVDILDVTNSGNANDNLGHGTAIAGILVGTDGVRSGFKSVAPGAKLKSYKITYEDKDAYGNVIDIKTNNTYIEQAVLNVLEYNKYRPNSKVDIINISYGLTDQNKLLEDVLARAYNSGITIIASAGNNSGAVVYPAAYDFIIAVGAITPEKQIYPVSSYGPNLDFVAPGADLFAIKANGGYQWLDGGTSYSAAYLSGVAALVIEAYYTKYGRKPSPQEVYSILQKISSPLPSVPGNKQGNGLPDASKIKASI